MEDSVFYPSSDLGLLVIRSHVDPMLYCDILAILPRFGLTVSSVSIKPAAEMREKVEEEYEEHKGKPFYDKLVESMISGNTLVIVTVWNPKKTDDEPVWKKLRRAVGATNPSEAEPNTIRYKFGNKDGILRENAVHAPDSWEATQRSARIWLDECWDF